MPSFYTHYHFGRDFMKIAPERIKRIINLDKELFLFGNKGPDLFFFNIKNAINGKNPGTDIHNKNFSEVLNTIKKDFVAEDLETKTGSYFLGLVLHFLLDSSLHPTVEALKRDNYGHLNIESELDRYYLNLDGENEFKFKQSVLIPDKSAAKYIYPIYKNFERVDMKNVETSISNMAFVKNFFHNDSMLKEKIILGILGLIGHRHTFGGQLITHKPFPYAENSNKILSEMYDDTLKIAPEFLDKTLEYMFENGEELENYRKDFNGV